MSQQKVQQLANGPADWGGDSHQSTDKPCAVVANSKTIPVGSQMVGGYVEVAWMLKLPQLHTGLHGLCRMLLFWSLLAGPYD